MPVPEMTAVMIETRAAERRRLRAVRSFTVVTALLLISTLWVLYGPGAGLLASVLFLVTVLLCMSTEALSSRRPETRRPALTLLDNGDERPHTGTTAR